jgi:hypothetical protein
MRWLFHDPKRDPRLGAELRELEATSPRSDSELHQRILAAAAPRLTGLRSGSPHWWEWILRWMPVAVPLGLAASLAAGMILPQAEDSIPAGYSTEVAPDSTLIEAAYSEDPAGNQLSAHVVAPEGADWLLEEAVVQ